MRLSLLFVVVLTVILTGCQSGGGLTLSEEVTIGRDGFRRAGLGKSIDDAYAYAVLPTIGKGGLVIGGAYGEGQVFEQGKVIGTTAMSQGTVGLQLGGQKYRELILFQDKKALDNFTGDTFEFSGNASAVAVEAGASTTADYSNGVAVFTQSLAGLMFEASIGGQQFTFTRN